MNSTLTPSSDNNVFLPGAVVKFANHGGAVDKIRGTVIPRGEAIRADYRGARRADPSDVPVRFDDGHIGWYMPVELEVVEHAPAPARPAEPINDLKVTVDRIAGHATGRPVVTIKFTAPAELFDVPVDRWADVAIAEACKRHEAAVVRRATGLGE